MDEHGWFKALPKSARERVLADIYERHFNGDDTVARRGDLADAWLGVAEGLLKISAAHRSGKVVMHTGIPEGSWVGEGAVIKRELRKYDVIAVRSSRVLFVPGSTFRWLLDTSTEFCHLIIASLNERLGQYITMVEIDRLTDPVARVARSIGTLYNPILYPHMSALLHLSQSELGELIGFSRQRVNVALKRLEAEGLISTQYGGVLVENLPALIAYQEEEDE